MNDLRTCIWLKKIEYLVIDEIAKETGNNLRNFNCYVKQYGVCIIGFVVYVQMTM